MILVTASSLKECHMCCSSSRLSSCCNAGQQFQCLVTVLCYFWSAPCVRTCPTMPAMLHVYVTCNASLSFPGSGNMKWLGGNLQLLEWHPARTDRMWSAKLIHPLQWLDQIALLHSIGPWGSLALRGLSCDEEGKLYSKCISKQSQNGFTV